MAGSPQVPTEPVARAALLVRYDGSQETKLLALRQGDTVAVSAAHGDWLAGVPALTTLAY